MTNLTYISQLGAASAVASADIVPITQGSSGPGTGTTRQATVAQILAGGLPAAFSTVTSTVLQTSTTYANDAAAAAGGVPVGQFYRNGSVVQIRIV